VLEIRDLTTSYAGIPVLQGINFTVELGEIFCLLGPSGCGKTTLLRTIAGLESLDDGDILIDGKSIQRTPVHTRDFGLMFQEFALFPHLNVLKNVLFGLKMRGIAPDKQRRRAEEVLALVGLADFAQRDVAQLSGGEKQRVALARSLAPNPRLLMLDEPLGSLDAGLRDRLVVELRVIIKQCRLTSIYVTHDQQEAFAVADRIAVMNNGQIEQIDSPEKLYRQPKTVFVAQFLGLANIVPTTHYHNGIADTPIGNFSISQPVERVLIHPDGIHLVGEKTTNTVTGRIAECVFQGGVYRLRVKITPEIIFTVKATSYNGNAPQPGDEVGLTFDETAIIPLIS